MLCRLLYLRAINHRGRVRFLATPELFFNVLNGQPIFSNF